jgi:hypothetical protein
MAEAHGRACSNRTGIFQDPWQDHPCGTEYKALLQVVLEVLGRKVLKQHMAALHRAVAQGKAAFVEALCMD